MTVIEDRLALLDTLLLDSGSHDDWEQGACVMEAVSYVAGEPWSDHPTCASRVITHFLISLNDHLGHDKRQLLKPYIPRLVGTNTGPADEETRRWIICDWLVHEYAPAMFRAVGATAEAETFEQLVPVRSADDWESCRSTIRRVRDEQWERRRAADAVAAAAAAAAAAADAVAVAVAAAAAAAAAAADAAADAVAVAVAAAVAAAAADAVADAAAAADAVAVADADAVADAVAAAVADADVYTEAAEAAAKAGPNYWDQRQAAYKVLRPHYDRIYKDKLAPVSAGLEQSVFLLVDRMIEVGRS